VHPVYCDRVDRLVAMPSEERDKSYVGVSSSVAVFLLVTSICCVLSVSYLDEPLKNLTNESRADSTEWEYRSGIPNVALLCVMVLGVVAMVTFLVRRDDLSTDDRRCPLTSRHDRHSKYSLWSVTVFFVGVFILDFNYLVVEVSCHDKWSYDCPYFLLNLFEVLYHVGSMVFTSCEIIVCWTVKHRNFRASQLVWHGVAVVQAANIALWFNLLLEESYRRSEDSGEVFDPYFRMCNAGNATEARPCANSRSFFRSAIPFLFPVTIEFSLLVSEAFLDRSIGASSHRHTEDADQVDGREPNRADQRAPANELTPLVGGRNENESPHSSFLLKMFILVTFIVNIIYLMLSILLLVAYVKDNVSETMNNTFVFYDSVYSLFLVVCCVVGIRSCSRFWRLSTHTSFLEYLLLFATCGVLLQSIKTFVYFADDKPQTDWVYIYYMDQILYTLQAPLQIVLYYYAKDVKPYLLNVDGLVNRPSRIAVFKSMMIVMFISNLVIWISDSFIYPDMITSISPSEGHVVEWKVFDNVVNPITVFFRFNSALLFFSIFTDKKRSRRNRRSDSDGDN